MPAAHLESGGYHNEYLTALAEHGLLGFVAVVSLFLFLFRCSWNLAFRRSLTWKRRQWALFGCLVLLFRAAVEVPGLFGYAQEPSDFLAYLFLAIVVSRISVEEDYSRSKAAVNIDHTTRNRLRQLARPTNVSPTFS
jgi:O-antigen ligase